jgi:hypothetical protein
MPDGTLARSGVPASGFRPLGLGAALWAMWLAGCSSSGSSNALAAPPVGVPVPDCVTFDSGAQVQSPQCPRPGLCGGTLLGPNTPVSYCTVDCSMQACPAGTVCETKLVNSHCLKKCSADSDCAGGFVCVSNVGNAGSVCWTPFRGADAKLDASAGG